MLSRIYRPVKNCNRFRYLSYKPDHKNYPPELDYLNFAVSCYNCVLVIAVLWGIESHNEKVKVLNESTMQLSDLFIECKRLLKKCKQNDE
tara:strand:- start:1385 stop:1654 length:270 start_codon:yes stop_codon:yes gene_type:complete